MDFAYNLTNISHKTQIYNTPGTHIYNLPKGITMVSITAIGGGGGGGGGVTRAAGANGGGGGGGGSASVTRTIISKYFLSNSLIVLVGAGGAGGAAGLAGTAGGQTIVSVNYATSTLTNLNIALSQGGGAGNPGTGAAGGTGGASGAVVASTSMGMSSLGTFTSRIGIAGGDAILTGSPATIIYGSLALPLIGGRGGAGIGTGNISANGGAIGGRGVVESIAGGTAGGGNGINGKLMMRPFASVGGTGGSSNSGGNGGNGGNGVAGSGGGGGGAGTAAGVGGTGGSGGNGMVIITCW
jgi:hypothetical protein